MSHRCRSITEFFHVDHPFFFFLLFLHNLSATVRALTLRMKEFHRRREGPNVSSRTNVSESVEMGSLTHTKKKQRRGFFQMIIFDNKR